MALHRIEHYEIVKELGRGGMGVVYQGRDTRVERDVAIKVLPKEMVIDARFRERFEREARAIIDLEHSAIVPIYDIGEADGQPYLVMRLMGGGSLGERIRKGPMSLQSTLPIVERVASALTAAHAKGIVHRDVKPGNILFDSYGEAFLSDFGIVKLVESASTQLTETGGTIGTVAYMAPEMAETGEASPQTDVYALGVTLYQMLTGEVPYSGTTPVVVMLAHINRPIPRVADLRPDLPAGVQAVIGRAMAKDPAIRYQSAEAMAADLRKVVLGQQVAPPPPPSRPAALDEAATQPEPIPARTGSTTQEVERRGPGSVLLGVLGGVVAAALVVAIAAVLVVPRLIENLNAAADPTPPVETPSVVEAEAGDDDGQGIALGQATQPPLVITATPEPTATPTATPTVTPTPTQDPDTLFIVQQVAEQYDEEERYLLQTLDTTRIGTVARETALNDRLAAVATLEAAAPLNDADSCAWRITHRGFRIVEVEFITASRARVIVELDRDGTVFCDETELPVYAYTGPYQVVYEIAEFSDGWYVVERDNYDPEEAEESEG